MLDYIALGALIFITCSLLFGAIAIAGIPYRIAAQRGHPHQEAIRFAGWVSLFTLHLLWPLLYVWSTAYREPSGPAFAQIDEDTAVNDKSLEAQLADADVTDSVSLLGHKYEVLDDRIERIEKAIMAATEAA